jgi:molybdate transport system permease protein
VENSVRSNHKEIRRAGSDLPFLLGLAIIGLLYIGLIVAMVVADAAFTTPGNLWRALASPEIRYAIKLSLISCSITGVLSLWVAVPTSYLMSRHRFPGQGLLDAILDIPIVLPPLIVGLSLLILFQTPPGRFIQQVIPVTYAVPGVILAQFAVAAAFAVRAMRITFDQISPRSEQVALTLGCTRARAFWLVVLPEARRGMLTAFTLAWARALGEFGPILVFCGATRLRTEVLSTSVFLELSIGNLEAAVAVSLLMIFAAIAVLLVVRLFGSEAVFGKGVEP